MRGRICSPESLPRAVGGDFWGSIAPCGEGQIDLLRRGGRDGAPGDGAIHHPPHLCEPPLGALGTAMAGDEAAPPSGKAEFQLANLTVFELICISHNFFPFVKRTTLREGVGQRLSTQNIFQRIFFLRGPDFC